jgi:hypothetical protein
MTQLDHRKVVETPVQLGAGHRERQRARIGGRFNACRDQSLLDVGVLVGRCDAVACEVGHNEGDGVVGVVLAAELAEQVDDPVGDAAVFGVERGGAEAVDEPERGLRVAAAEILRVAVALLYAVGGVVAKRRVHPLRGDHQLGSVFHADMTTSTCLT